MRKIIPLEHDEQVTFVQKVKYEFRNEPTFKEKLFGSAPNGAFLGGKTPKQRGYQMAKLKSEGLNTGFPDLIYLQPRGTYPYAAIEMKRINAGNHKDYDLSEDQLNFRIEAKDAGAYYILAFGADHAFEQFCDYMSLPVRAPVWGPVRGKNG